MKIKSFIQEEVGTTQVEYAIMIALILAVCVSTIGVIGGQMFDVWGENADGLTTAVQSSVK